MLLTIIANCVVLAVEKPLPEEDKTLLTRQLVRIPASLSCCENKIDKAVSFQFRG